MKLRVLLILALGLASGGMLLHHVVADCGGTENCPICQQIQLTPAEASSATYLGCDLGSFESVEFFCAPQSTSNDLYCAAPRGPPLS
jgi:hypothetical protein